MESNSVLNHTSEKQNLLITKMIKGVIGLNEALLPINHNYNKMGNVLALLKIIIKKEIPRIFLLAVKKSHLIARDGAYCPLSCYTVLSVLKSRQLIASQIWEFCYSYDL